MSLKIEILLIPLLAISHIFAMSEAGSLRWPRDELHDGLYKTTLFLGYSLLWRENND
jgi:hypothetical protein